MSAPEVLRPDVCIVGSGIAGALLAHRLAGAGSSVLMLDAGPRHPMGRRFEAMQAILDGKDPWAPDDPERDRYVSAGEIDYPVNERRVKAVGGATLHWAGFTPRYHESDFEMRSRFGLAADWPFSYAELEPFYCEAESELGVAGTDDNPFAAPRSKPYPLPAFPIGYEERTLGAIFARLGIRHHSFPQARNSRAYAGRSACQTYGVCKACPVHAKYTAEQHVLRAEATGRVRVLPHASVVRLETRPRSRVRRAVYADRDGVEHAVEAGLFVLTAGAVESARLLLLSASAEHPDGLGNASGCVGRYFMEHVGRRHFAEADFDFAPYRKGFHTTYSEQFYDHPARDRWSAVRITWTADVGQPEDLARHAIRKSGHWGDALEEELRTRLRGGYGRDFEVGFMPEPLPSESNRVELDPDAKDRFGHPAPRVSLSVSDYERAAWKEHDARMLALIEAAGGRPVETRISFGGHQSGTLRMGRDPARSVVDAHQRSHEVENLYVAGASTFPTIGAVEPTLTIAATTLRLAAHLLSVRHAG